MHLHLTSLSLASMGEVEAKRSVMSSLWKRIAIISLYLCSLASAHADEPRREDPVFHVGGFLGGGLVDWIGKDANGSLPGEEEVPKPGFAAGLLTTVDVSRLLSLGIEPFLLAVQPEIAYATKGAAIEIDGEDRGTFNLSYLQAGLLLRTEYAAGRAAPYFVLGPALGFLRSAELERTRGDTVDGKDDFKSTDVGLILGLGTMFELPPYGALGLELRADLGLVSIDGQGDGDEIRNAALTLLLAYLY